MKYLQTSFQNKRHMPVANIISPIIAVNHDSLNCSETVIGIFTGGGCLPLTRFWWIGSVFALWGCPFC